MTTENDTTTAADYPLRYKDQDFTRRKIERAMVRVETARAALEDGMDVREAVKRLVSASRLLREAWDSVKYLGMPENTDGAS